MLETERLLMRKFTSEDLDKLIELRSDEEVFRYMGGRQYQNAAALAKRLKDYIESYERPESSLFSVKIRCSLVIKYFWRAADGTPTHLLRLHK